MGKIIALGGGRYDNGEMDNVIVKTIELTNKKNPLVLYLPTASYDNCTMDDDTIVRFEKFGCETDVLFLTREETTESTIKEKIDRADIIYVFGGNLEFLMNNLKRTKTDEYLKKAYDEGKVLTGLSSGSMCWFKEGYDDCGENGSFMFVDCLNLIPYINCPHYQSENWQTFAQAVKTRTASGIAEDNGAAFCLIDGVYSVMSGNEDGDCYFYDKENGFEMTNINENQEILKDLKVIK